MKIRIHSSVKRVAQSEGIKLDLVAFRRRLRHLAEELTVADKVNSIVVLGSEGSAVELMGGFEGNVVVYSLNPYYAQDNEVRHELMHIADRLNPEFQFDFADASLAADDYPPARRTYPKVRISRWTLLNELWNVNIDGRLRGLGIPRHVRYASFVATVRYFTRLSTAECRALYRRLWTDELVSYTKLKQETDGLLIRSNH